MLSSPALLLLSVLQCFLFSPFASAATSVNVTIDDTSGDSLTGIKPTYSANWNVGQKCLTCAVTPEASEAFMGTWHDTTSNVPQDKPHTVTMTFRGASSCMCLL